MSMLDLTPTQQQARAQHRAFRARIEQKAAELQASKLRPLTERTTPPVKALVPEALPAEPDPPAPSMRHWFEIEREVPSVAAIQVAVANYFGLTRNDILSARRTHDVVLPRHIAVYLAKELTPFSLPVLGRLFGGRDHSTQLHAVRRIAGLIKTDPAVARVVVELLILLTGNAR